MKRKSPTSRAISAQKTKTYLMGYVAGIIYHDGGEWLLTKDGRISSSYGDKKYRLVGDLFHIWGTENEAKLVARKLVETGSNYPVFTRPYTYETANPENAKKMKRWYGGTPRTMIEKE